MIGKTAKDYKFAIGRKIKRIFTESELYLDGNYREDNTFEKLSIRRIDQPIFVLLDNDVLARLYATSFSIADDYEKEYVFSENFTSDIKAQKEFEKLCGLTIIEIKEIYENKYDYFDEDGTLPSYLDELPNGERIRDLVLLFDNGLRILCYMFLDFFDIEIVENNVVI